MSDTLTSSTDYDENMAFSEWMQVCPKIIATAAAAPSRKMALSLQTFCAVVKGLDGSLRERLDANVDNKCTSLLKMCDTLLENHLPQVFEETSAIVELLC